MWVRSEHQLLFVLRCQLRYNEGSVYKGWRAERVEGSCGAEERYKREIESGLEEKGMEVEERGWREGGSAGSEGGGGREGGREGGGGREREGGKGGRG